MVEQKPDAPARKRRLFWLAAAGAMFVLIAIAYRQFWLAKPVGRGPAGPEVPRAQFSRFWTERKVVLLGIGDSITAGLGASRSELRYFNRLVRNPPDEFDDLRQISLSNVIPHLEARNLAVSGSNSIQHLAGVEQIEAFPKDVLGIVVMTTGGNDLIHWYGRTAPHEGAMYGATVEQARPWIKGFEQRLSRMLDLLPQKFPGGCEVFLGDIYDPSDGVGDAPSAFLPDWPDAMKIHQAYNAVIHKCTQRREHVHLVPIHEHFLGHGIHCRQFWREHYRADDPHYWYWYNLEDPNDRGYDALRRLFLLRMADVLGPDGDRSPGE